VGLVATFDEEGLRGEGRRNDSEREGRGAAHGGHFKQSDEISNQRHATASQAVLVFLQRVRERRGGGHHMEANAKGAVEWSYLTQAQTLRRCIPKLLIGKYPLAS
jgi:hypothetical protein